MKLRRYVASSSSISPISARLELILGWHRRVVVTAWAERTDRRTSRHLRFHRNPALYCHPRRSLAAGDLGMSCRRPRAGALASGETGPKFSNARPPSSASARGSSPSPRTASHPATATSLIVAQAPDVALDCSIYKEACLLGLAPRPSKPPPSRPRDALAVALSERRGFRAEDFCHLHPVANSASASRRVSQLMQRQRIPASRPPSHDRGHLRDVARKGLYHRRYPDDVLIGIISDGTCAVFSSIAGKDGSTSPQPMLTAIPHHLADASPRLLL